MIKFLNKERIRFQDQKIENEGKLWIISGNAKVIEGKILLKVHRIHGDVTAQSEKDFAEALENFAAYLDLRIMTGAYNG